MLLCCLIIDVISDFIYYFQPLAMFVFWSGYGILFFFLIELDMVSLILWDWESQTQQSLVA